MEVSQISPDLLIFETQFSQIFLCPTPALPGHILITPKNCVRSFS